MPPYPKIKFITDYKQDITNCLNFFKWHHKDEDDCLRKFLPSSLHFILNKNFSAKERAKIIRAHTKFYYAKHQQFLKSNIKQTQKAWLKRSPKYFQLIDKIFKGHPWPKGNYRAFGSIYNMYPRYLESKIFYFPGNTPGFDFPLKVIAHEMIHFIYFDYLKKNYNLNQESKIKGKPDNYVWLVSEIFNYTLEGWKPYTDIMKNESRRQPYFGELKLCQQMKRDWHKTPDIDWLINKWLK